MSENYPRVKVSGPHNDGPRYSVTIDGKEVAGRITGIHIDAAAGKDYAIVSIDFPATIETDLTADLSQSESE